mgnify:FL=1
MEFNKPTLSICLSCRDGREEIYMTRGGRRFAKKLLNKNLLKKQVNLRGINCMSNCKRACTISLTAKKSFTYVFGDIDPENSEYSESLIELVSKYSLSSDGFLRRRDRPLLFQSSILGRLPPIQSNSEIVTNLNNGFPDD